MSLLKRLEETLEPYDEPNVPPGFLRLHFNENLFLPDEYYMEILRRVEERFRVGGLRHYTEPLSSGLSQAIEEYHSTPRGTVQVFAGADDALRAAMMAAVHGSKSVVIVEPTYGMASIIAAQLGLRVVKLTYSEDLALDVDAVVRTDSDAVYVCSPNNPTGHLVKELEDLASRTSQFVILDAAYAEYAGLWRPKLYEYGNVIEVRTFSKAWGLAGVRVGYTVSSPQVRKVLSALALPHPISSFSEAVVTAALELDKHVRDSVARTVEVRDYVASKLYAKFSGGNFVTLAPEGAEKLHRWLWENRVATRLITGKPMCRECVRITVAPLETMQRVISLVEEWFNRSGRGPSPA